MAEKHTWENIYKEIKTLGNQHIIVVYFSPYNKKIGFFRRLYLKFVQRVISPYLMTKQEHQMLVGKVD